MNGASEAVSALTGFHPSTLKPRACSDRSGRAASVAPWPALLHPGKRPPGCKAQRRFANRASRRCGGSLPVVVSGAIHLFKPLSPGLIQPQPAALTVQGK